MRTPTARCGAIARLVAGLVWAAATKAAGAQAVRGIVTDGSRRPTPGVVVLLLDSATQVAARALSDERGAYRLAAPRAGTYRIRTLRIGYRPILSDPFALASGDEVTRQLVITDLPISLDTIRVVDRNVCRAFTDSGAATFSAWEQIRTALTAAQLTAASRALAATTVNYERHVGARPGINDGKVLQRSAVVRTGYVTNPWQALPADSLRHSGYVVTELDGSTTYYAPDLDVLLSPTFVEDHCFRLVRDRAHQADLGIAFAPVPDRRRLAEIRGTIWIDRASSELRGLDFDYVNVPPEQAGRAGGDLRFVHLRDGTWVISEWEIRMPLLEQVMIPGHMPEIRMKELHATGGELALARRDADTLWTGRRLSVGGSVIDSTSGEGVANARVRLAGTALAATTDVHGRFTLDGVLPGVYDLEIHTPALDSLNASQRTPVSIAEQDSRLEARLTDAAQIVSSLCGAPASAGAWPELRGIIVGRVRPWGSTSAGALLASATTDIEIIAEWREPLSDAAPADSTAMTVRRVATRVSGDGGFRLCRLPVTTAVSVRAIADGAEAAEPQIVRFAPGTRLAHADLTLDDPARLAARGAVFTGFVVTDSTHMPIAGAEVALPDIAKSALTDAAGGFRLTGIPPGEQRVLVRRLGFGAADAKLTFHPNEMVERRVVLGRAAMLEPVMISEREIERRMASFDEHRRIGFGHFMTRAEIAKYDGMTMTSALSELGPAVRLLGGRTTIWVTSNRAPLPTCRAGDTTCLESHGYYVGPDGPVACYSLVYVDRILMNGVHEPTEPFDLRQIAPERVEAMEFYAGPSETPSEYSRLGSPCGVLVIWTRY